MFLYINHFCSTWNSEGLSFNQVVQKLKDTFKIVDNYIRYDNVKSHFEYINTPTKFQSHPINFITYDSETHNTDRTRPYVFCSCRLSKLAGRYNRDLTHDEIQNCKKDSIVFKGVECDTKGLDFCL